MSMTVKDGFLGADGEEPSGDKSGYGNVNDNDKKRRASNENSGDKKRVGRVIKDEKSSSIAAKRQIDAFIRQFDSRLSGLPNPDGTLFDWPTVNAKFLEYAKKGIMDDTDILEYDKEKLLHELMSLFDWPTVNEKFLEYAEKVIKDDEFMSEYNKKKLSHVLMIAGKSDTTYAKTWLMTVECLGKQVSRASASPNRRENVIEMVPLKYENHDCPVCKVKEKKVISNNGHDCPYCHDCFKESGWEKKIVRLDECTNHVQGKLKGP